MIIETKMAVVAVIAAIGGALIQQVSAASGTSENNVVLYIAAMSSFVAFCGVVVTGFVQWSASRDARDAARDARLAAQETAAIAATAAKEARESAAVQQKTIDNVEHLVNSKADKQAEIIRELTLKVDALNAAALAKAEASPAVGGVPAIGAAQPSLLVPTPGAPAALGTGAVQVSVPVHLVDQSKPVDVKVVEDEPPPKKK